MKPIESDYPPEFKRNRRKMTYAVIAVAVAVSIVFIASGMQYSGTVNVIWLQVDIQYPSGQTYFGPAVEYIQENIHTIPADSVHTFTIILHNYGKGIHAVTSIVVGSQGFSLKTLNVRLPQVVQPGHSLTITFTVSVPSENYAGNLIIIISTQ